MRTARSSSLWSKRVGLILLMLAVASCGGEHSSSTASDAAAVVKETLAAARAKQRVRIRVRLERAELPTPEELKVRDALEDQLTAERLGTVVNRGAGVGWFDVEIDVDSSGDAVPRMRAILESMGLLEKSSIEIRQAG